MLNSGNCLNKQQTNVKVKRNFLSSSLISPHQW